jgi:DNA mismatch repair protein MutS
VSIAWSVSEHLHDAVGCKTVFATHYHELVQLAAALPAVRNYNVLVREVGDQVLFLHRLAEGGASRSYGIEVGRLAGLPPAVLARAREVLAELEGRTASAERRAPSERSPGARRSALGSHDQLGLFAAPAPPHPVVEELKALDPDNLTPMQALALVARLAERARQG